MTSPAHPSLRTFPRLQLLFSATYLPPFSFSLSSQLCFNSNPPTSVLLSEQLDTVRSLSVSLSLSAISSSLLFSLPPCLTLTLLHICSFPSLRLAIGGRVFPSSHSNFPPSIHPCCFSVIPLLLSLTNPSFAFYLCCCFFSLFFCSLTHSLSFSFLLSRCCCFIIVGAPSSCILST